MCKAKEDQTVMERVTWEVARRKVNAESKAGCVGKFKSISYKIYNAPLIGFLLSNIKVMYIQKVHTMVAIMEAIPMVLMDMALDILMESTGKKVG